MRIGFVAEPYEEKNASGMGYVILELMRNLPREGAAHEFIFYSSRPIDRAFVPGKYHNVIIPHHFVKKLWFFFTMKERPQALIFMVPMMPLIIRGIHAIPMCQELASQKIPPQGLSAKLFAFVRDQILMRISFARASHIIAASEATKKDLMHFYGIAPERVAVSYDGFQSLELYKDEAVPVAQSKKPYFFFIGKVKYRKNVHGIVSAFIQFKKRVASDCQLVIAGDYGGSYYETIKKEIEGARMDDSVHFVGYTVKGALYSYYKDALACVFPSINEGFGMPIVEAMSLGTPVITSKISSMAEVAEDAALLVDPHDVDAISGAMEKVYNDESLRARLIGKGKERAKDFSWPKAAREYVRVVESL